MPVDPEVVAGIGLIESPSLNLPVKNPTMISIAGVVNLIPAGSSTPSPIAGGSLTVGPGLAGAGTVASPATPDPGTVVTLGADAQNWDFATGLAGDTDGDYWIKGYITTASAGQIISLQPNGADPTLFSGAGTGALPNSVPSAVGQGRTTMLIADSGADKVITFEATLQSKSGRNRFFHVLGYRGLSSGSDEVTYNLSGVDYDTATVFSSLRLRGSAASSIKAGSIIIWGKLGRAA